MPLAAIETLPQFIQHLLDRRVAQLEASAVRHDIRLPAALHTPPGITLEAEEAKLSVVAVIAAFRRRPALPVPLPFVRKAVRAFNAERPATR